MAPVLQLCGMLGRLRRDGGGSAMLQFALVAPVFFLLLFMLVEESLLLFTQSQLDDATLGAARSILIGTFQTSSKGLSDFQNAVCGGIVGIIPSCGSNIQVYADADGVDPSNLAIAGNGYWNGTSGTFNVGGPSQYMILQVGYRFPYFIPWFANITGGGSALILSTLVFQVEPYR
jgi:Flp pilus assembly protein TadG